MSNSRQPSFVFSHLKRSSHGDSISLSFVDLVTGDTNDTSDSSISSTPQIRIIFSAKAHTRFGWELFICGDLKELGCWNPSLALPLKTSPETYPIWTCKPISLPLPSLPFSFEYKFIIAHTNGTVIWEGLKSNRIATITEKCAFWTVFPVFQEFGVYSRAEFALESADLVTRRIQSFAKASFGAVLEGLAEIIESETVDCHLVQMVAQVLKGFTYISQEAFELISAFIERILCKVTQADIKTMLNYVHVAELELKNPSESFISKADNYETSNENLDEEIIQTFKLSDLRKSIFAESKNLKNSVSLLLTDNNLETKEIDLVEKIIENIEEKCSVWKIALVGKWICEMLFYNFIRLKQVKMLICQFERLEKKENLEVLRDLLYEMKELILEEYCERLEKTNHFDLEVVCKSFGVEYQMVYYNIFFLASKFIIKTVTIVNRCLLRTPYVCYSPGKCAGKLRTYDPDYRSWQENHILLVNKPDEYIELNEKTVGIVATGTYNLLLPVFIKGNAAKLPVAIGLDPSFRSEECSMMLTEDYCWLTRTE